MSEYGSNRRGSKVGRSPEAKFMELLSEIDEQLPVIKATFGGDIEHARRVILLYLKCNIIVLKHSSTSGDRLLDRREATQVLEDPANWNWSNEVTPKFYVCMTDKAFHAYEAGPAAWERLFDRNTATNEH